MNALILAWIFVAFIAGAGLAMIVCIAALSVKRERLVNRYAEAMARYEPSLRMDLTQADAPVVKARNSILRLVKPCA